MRRAIITAVAAFAVILSVPSTTLASQPRAGGDSDAGLVIHEQGSISYVSGGIGNEQQTALARMGGRFNLKLTLATADGKYIGGANVRIQNANGESVLDTQSEGPLFLAKLPAGTYKIDVTGNGKAFTRNVTLRDNGQQQVTLTWPATNDEPVRAGDSPE